MRNHHDKARDMARSVLPSTARKSARRARAQIHGRERARLRGELQKIYRLVEPDGFEGDLAWRAGGDLEEMVGRRRQADKVAPLLTWAERLVERDPVLCGTTLGGREAYFRKLLPPGLIGNHAISHLSWVLDDDRRRWRWPDATTVGCSPDVEIVEAIIAAGCHGDLNRRLRDRLDRIVKHSITLGPERLIDADHPAPGVLLPRRTVTERRRRDIRFLAGAHDAVAFVADSDCDARQVVRAFHAEISGRQGLAEHG